jgi:hypothetical protein
VPSRKKRGAARKSRKKPPKKRKPPRKKPAPSSSIFARVRLAPTRKVLAPGSPFARVAPPPTHFPEGMTPRWGRFSDESSPLGEVPHVSAREEADIQVQNNFDDFIRLDVDPTIAAELSNLRADQTYVVIAKVRGGSGRAGKDGRKGREDENTVIQVGSGRKLWGIFAHLADPGAGGSELLDVEVLDAPPAKKDDAFPLWSGDSITLDDGRTIEGTGQRLLWELERAKDAKRGKPRKKSGGRMTAEQRRKAKTADRSREKRAKKTAKRIRELMKTDPTAAIRLRKKSERARNKPKRKR